MTVPLLLLARLPEKASVDQGVVLAALYRFVAVRSTAAV